MEKEKEKGAMCCLNIWAAATEAWGCTVEEMAPRCCCRESSAPVTAAGVEQGTDGRVTGVMDTVWGLEGTGYWGQLLLLCLGDKLGASRSSVWSCSPVTGSAVT